MFWRQQYNLGVHSPLLQVQTQVSQLEADLSSLDIHNGLLWDLK